MHIIPGGGCDWGDQPNPALYEFKLTVAPCSLISLSPSAGNATQTDPRLWWWMDAWRDMLQPKTPLLCLFNDDCKFCPRSLVHPLAPRPVLQSHSAVGICRPSIDYEKPRAHQNMIVNHNFIRLMSHFFELINNKQVLYFIPPIRSPPVSPIY